MQIGSFNSIADNLYSEEGNLCEKYGFLLCKHLGYQPKELDSGSHKELVKKIESEIQKAVSKKPGKEFLWLNKISFCDKIVFVSSVSCTCCTTIVII